MPGKTKWFQLRREAEIETRIMLLTMRDNKASGDVVVYRIQKFPSTGYEFIKFLNGLNDMKPIRVYTHMEGKIVSRNKTSSGFNLKNAWFFPEIHPTKSHASWIYFIDNNIAVKELVVRAPDPKSLHIAFTLSGITTDDGGVRLTKDIAKYVWNYTHNMRLDSSD